MKQMIEKYSIYVKGYGKKRSQYKGCFDNLADARKEAKKLSKELPGVVEITIRQLYRTKSRTGEDIIDIIITGN